MNPVHTFTPHPALAPMNVLIVDDSEGYADALAMALEMDGYHASVARGGMAALDAVGTNRPDCVLLDFGMDDLDGLDLTKQLRASYQDDIVLIMITGWDTTQPRVAEAATLVDHHFEKPLNLAELRRILPPLGSAGGLA